MGAGCYRYDIKRLSRRGEAHTISASAPYLRKKGSGGRRKGGMGRTVSTILLAAAVLIAALVIIADLLLKKPLKAIAEEEANAIAGKALNEAVLSVMRARAKTREPQEFTRLEKDESGASMLFIDAEKLNLLASEIVDEAQSLMENACKLTAKVPLGTASGIAAFTGAGPAVEISFDPVGSVASKFSSSFTSEGINQTRYSAYILLTANVRLLIGGVDEIVTVNHTAALCETVIIGEVPQAYTNVDSVDDALNLIPTDVE